MTENLVWSLQPLIVILIPFAASLMILYSDDENPGVKEGIVMCASVIMATLVFTMAPKVASGLVPGWSGFMIVEGISFSLKADPAGMVFACVSSFLWVVVSLYSFGYMRAEGDSRLKSFYASFAVCLCAAEGICFSANLVTFFIFFELLTVATYPLVIHHGDEESKRAGRKYLAYTITGGQLFLIGIVIIYTLTGTTDFVPGGFLSTDTAPRPVLIAAFVLLVIAGLIKAGMMPFHSWLPDAMVAPTPVSALLHAVAVVKAGGFLVIRMICYVFGPKLCSELGVTAGLAVMASVTILIASLVARKQDVFKRRLAFSTISQLSYIILGVSILAPLSITGAIYHIVSHAFMKITLFMCAGAIMVTEHKTRVSELDGIGYRMPVTIFAYSLCAMGICGMPFTTGFLSKVHIMLGAASRDVEIYIIILLVSAVLNVSYLMPIPLRAFRHRTPSGGIPGMTDGEGNCSHGRFEISEADLLMLIPIIVTASVVLILGVSPNAGLHLFDLAKNASVSITSGGL